MPPTDSSLARTGQGVAAPVAPGGAYGAETRASEGTYGTGEYRAGEGGAYGTERAYGTEARGTETYTTEVPAMVQQVREQYSTCWRGRGQVDAPAPQLTVCLAVQCACAWAWAEPALTSCASPSTVPTWLLAVWHRSLEPSPRPLQQLQS